MSFLLADHDFRAPSRGHDFLDAPEVPLQYLLLAAKEGNRASATDKGEAEVKEGSHEGVRGHVMFHHEESSARPQDANDLLQCHLLRLPLQLIEGVRTGDCVEGFGREGKAPCIGFHQIDVGKAPGLFLGYFQHARGKIHANDLAIRADFRLQVSEKRTRTGAEVENRAAVLYWEPYPLRTSWLHLACRENAGRRSHRKTSKRCRSKPVSRAPSLTCPRKAAFLL